MILNGLTNSRQDDVKSYRKKEATVSFTFLGMAGLMVKQRLRVTRLT